MEPFQNTGQPDWDWWGRLWPTPGETLRRLGLTSGASVAEIGSGNGYFALPAARIAAPAPVYAVDLDASLLDELDALASQQAIENVVSVHGDARDLSELLPTSVDVCLLANAFHGIDDRAACLREIAAVLDPDGAFVVVNWRDRPREETTIAAAPRGPPTDLRLSADETTAIIADATDFSLTQQIDLPPYHYGLRFER